MATDEFDVLMDQLGRLPFVFHQFRGDRLGPEVLAAVHVWSGDVADVLILPSEDSARAFRALTGPGIDAFDPPHVLWWYASSAVWTLRVLLTLPLPDQADAPRTILDLPPGFGLPARGRRPVRVRLRGR